MLALFQYCNKCKCNRNFNPITLLCLKCKSKNKL